MTNRYEKGTLNRHHFVTKNTINYVLHSYPRSVWDNDDDNDEWSLFLRVSQFVPVKFSGQLHVYVFGPVDVQVPPFWHGLDRQAVMVSVGLSNKEWLTQSVNRKTSGPRGRIQTRLKFECWKKVSFIVLPFVWHLPFLRHSHDAYSPLEPPMNIGTQKSYWESEPWIWSTSVLCISLLTSIRSTLNPQRLLKSPSLADARRRRCRLSKYCRTFAERCERMFHESLWNSVNFVEICAAQYFASASKHFYLPPIG